MGKCFFGRTILSGFFGLGFFGLCVSGSKIKKKSFEVVKTTLYSEMARGDGGRMPKWESERFLSFCEF